MGIFYVFQVAHIHFVVWDYEAESHSQLPDESLSQP